MARGDFTPRLSEVGSRAGAVTVGPAYLLLRLSAVECLNSRAVVPFPAPASSNAACGFPALRFPARFTSRVMWPIGWGALSPARIVGPDSH